ncbi:MAG: tetratricopeptide repeat protein [Acidobacteriota bacterium]
MTLDRAPRAQPSPFAARRYRRAFGLALLLAGLGTARLLGQPAGTASTITTETTPALEVSPVTRQGLAHIQELWLQWMSAFYQNNATRADGLVSSALATAQQLGMSRLPDLSLGAAARAVQSARDGNLPRANWALQAAERLDPGRPETAFAAARVERLSGSYLQAVGWQIVGWSRLAGMPTLRRLWLLGAVGWGGAVLLLAAGLFVAVQMASKGSALLHDLEHPLRRRLPGVVARALAFAILLWPLALPGGVMGLVLFWSALLWVYALPRERVVLGLVFAIVGIVPLAVASAERALVPSLSPPYRAMDAVRDRRLVGTLFEDLGVLRSALPESAAARQFEGDVDRILGQWDAARNKYQEVVDAEPQNTAALIDIGAYYFRRSDFARAVEFFQRAATIDPKSAAAYYDLSQAYSEAYQFDESRRALAEARRIDDARITAWIAAGDPDRVITFDGGIARRDEIAQQYERSLRARAAAPGPIGGAPWGMLVPPLAALGAAGFALLLQFLRRRGSVSEPQLDLTVRTDRLALWLRTFLAGVPESEDRRPLAALGAVLVVAGLGALPWTAELGLRLPWGFDPGRVAEWTVALLGAAIFFGWRAQRELRAARME